MRVRTGFALVAAAAALACGGEDRGERGSAGAEGELREGGGAVVTDTMSAAQVAALVQLINGTERAAAKAVQPKLTAPAVQAYAGMLMADHASLMEAMPHLPGPSIPPPQAHTLTAVFHSQAALLGTLPAGYPFDATFLALQIGDHMMAIDSLQRWHGLVRGELRSSIAAALPVMHRHLETARSLYTRLDRGVDLGRPGPADTVPPTTAPGPRTLPADTASADTAAHHGHGHGAGG